MPILTVRRSGAIESLDMRVRKVIKTRPLPE
jgi:hypothetical protein